MRRTRRVLLVASAAALVAAAVPSLGASAAPATVSGYVVVLEPGSASPAAEAARLASRYGGQVGYVYRYALRGFYVRTTDRAAVAMASNPNVAYVEAESPVTIDAQTTPTGVARASASATQNIAIDGVDQRVDVDVAVLDTGIDLDHPDLAVAGSVSCVNVSTASSCSGTGNDIHGHGTHVAGTIAALDNTIGVVGVAPGARLWAIKVLGNSGSGSNAGVAAGLDWVAGTGDIEVANLSLGGGDSSVIKDAVRRTVNAGVTVVVAAGNDGENVANHSPANAPEAITVSALADFDGQSGGLGSATCYPDVDDTLADYSNFGSLVDMIAPGTCIYSTTPGSYGTKSGTSMASPHVAGAAALLRSMSKSRAETESLLKAEGTADWTGDRDATPEPLLNVSDTAVFAPTFVGSGGTPPPNSAPTAAFTSSCTGLTCNFTDTSTDSDGSIASRSWTFGDGATSTAANPSRTYASAGTYTVTLTVTDDDGAPATTSSSVTASAAPATGLTFTGSSSQGPKGTWNATITVTGGASGTTYSGAWNVGGTPSSCSTESSTGCSFTRTGIAKKVASVTWTPTSGQAVTILKP